jgi:hypothetical protein
MVGATARLSEVTLGSEGENGVREQYAHGLEGTLVSGNLAKINCLQVHPAMGSVLYTPQHHRPSWPTLASMAAPSSAAPRRHIVALGEG